MSGLLLWLGRRDSNPRDDGVKVRCLTAWRRPNKKTSCYMLYNSLVVTHRRFELRTP